jgi:peptidoglycan/xylan/chitin deacetylase (PgdA/CDA1 family)
VKAAKHDRHVERIRRRAEHVALPTARIQVQTRPAYYLADVVPEPPRRTLALTIDDGPDPDWTPTVLRLLDKYRMQATFCIVGVHVASYPRLVRDIARAGHAIVNHSYSHPLNFARLNERRIVHEITANQQLIEQTVKVTPQLFRSPGGDWSRFVYRALAAYDLLPLEWDVDPEDWTLPGRRVIQRRMLRAQPNDIVLCHDGGGDRQETVRALRRVLPKWKHSGYTVVPLRVPETRWQDLQR